VQQSWCVAGLVMLRMMLISTQQVFAPGRVFMQAASLSLMVA
jgi:hypothetical protein